MGGGEVLGLGVLFGSCYGAISSIPFGHPIAGLFVGGLIGLLTSPVSMVCLARKGTGDVISWVFMPMVGVSVVSVLVLTERATLAVIPAFLLACALGGVVLPARPRSGARGVCPSCGYSLAGLTKPVCPECGAAVEIGG